MAARREVEEMSKPSSGISNLGIDGGAARIDGATLGQVHVAAELALGQEPGAAGAVFGELRIVGAAIASLARRRGAQQAL